MTSEEADLRSQLAKLKAERDGWQNQASEIAASNADHIQRYREMVRVLAEMQALVAVMFGDGPDAVVPETILSPLAVPIKARAIMREVEAVLAEKPTEKAPHDHDSAWCGDCLDQVNHGAQVTAEKLLAIAQTGEHWGTFGGPKLEEAAQAILGLLKRLRKAEGDRDAAQHDLRQSRFLLGIPWDASVPAALEAWKPCSPEEAELRTQRGTVRVEPGFVIEPEEAPEKRET